MKKPPSYRLHAASGQWTAVVISLLSSAEASAIRTSLPKRCRAVLTNLGIAAVFAQHRDRLREI